VVLGFQQRQNQRHPVAFYRSARRAVVSNLEREIEYASHENNDKVEVASDVIGGSINFTNIALGSELADEEVMDDDDTSYAISSRRTMWRRRHARSAEEVSRFLSGIQIHQLSSF
jgi:hypothetical protein